MSWWNPFGRQHSAPSAFEEMHMRRAELQFRESRLKFGKGDRQFIESGGIQGRFENCQFVYVDIGK